MKIKQIILVSALAVLASCAPQIHVLNLDLKEPSAAGVKMDGKSLAIAYQDSSNPVDTAFCNAFATGLAQSIESQYFNSEQVVTIYRLPDEPEADYAHPDSLVRMVMDLNADVVMFLKRPIVSGTAVCENIALYDSMSKQEMVKNIKKYGFLNDYESDPQQFVDKAIQIGNQTGVAFESSWVPYNVFLYFYTKYGDWYQSMDNVYENDYASAIKHWISVTQNGGSPEEKSCAAYDIGVACFLMGEPSLALEWLDKSDEIYHLELTGEARKMVKTFNPDL